MSVNYSNSKCVACESKQFELVKETPYGSKSIVTLLRCFKCKTVMGVLDYMPLAVLEKQLKDIQDELHQIKTSL